MHISNKASQRDPQNVKVKHQNYFISPVTPNSLKSNNTMASEIEEVLSKIMAYRGVKGAIVANADGVPIKSTVDENTAILYSGLITQLCDKARSAVKELDASNEFTFMRLRSRQHEILVAPDVNFLLIVIQTAVASVEKKKGKKKSLDDDEEEEEDDDMRSGTKASGDTDASPMADGGDDDDLSLSENQK